MSHIFIIQPMPHPAAIIFDLDGTLIDSIPYHYTAWLEFFRNNGVTMSIEDFHAQNHGTVHEMIDRVFGKDISQEKHDQLCFEKEHMYRESYRPHIKEINGVTPFLNNLKKNQHQIALATMGNQLNIDFSIDTIGIRSFFDCITGGDEVQKGKPDPEIFHLTLRKLKLEPKDAIVFEDSAVGVIAAKTAGINVVGITTSHTHEELMELGCVDTINDYSHLKMSQLPFLQ